VLFLGGVGEVTVTLGHDGLSFQPLHPVRLPMLTSRVPPDSARGQILGAKFVSVHLV
jgi:hypothetical protein